MEPWYGRRRAVLFFGLVKGMNHIHITCTGLQSNLDMKFTDIFVLCGAVDCIWQLGFYVGCFFGTMKFSNGVGFDFLI